jgi:hypothetical protein
VKSILLSTHRSALFLEIRYQLAYIFLLAGGYQSALSKVPLAFFSLAGEQMALEALVPLDLTGRGDAKPFHRASVAFDFRHFVLPL